MRGFREDIGKLGELFEFLIVDVFGVRNKFIFIFLGVVLEHGRGGFGGSNPPPFSNPSGIQITNLGVRYFIIMKM